MENHNQNQFFFIVWNLSEKFAAYLDLIQAFGSKEWQREAFSKFYLFCSFLFHLNYLGNQMEGKGVFGWIGEIGGPIVIYVYLNLTITTFDSLLVLIHVFSTYFNSRETHLFGLWILVVWCVMCALSWLVFVIWRIFHLNNPF